MRSALTRLGSIGRWVKDRRRGPDDPYLRPLPGLEELLRLEQVFQHATNGQRGYLYAIKGVELTWYVLHGGYVTCSVGDAEGYLRDLIVVAKNGRVVW